MKIWAFIVLMASTAFSACIDNATDIVLSEQGALLSVVIGLTVVLIAISYALGSALGKAEYIVFAKDEIYHLLFSVVILIGFSGILVFSCHTMDLFYGSFFDNVGELESGCYSAGSGMNDVASCYISYAESDAKRLSESYVQNYIDYLMDSTFAWSIQWPLMNSFTSTAGAYKRIISNQYDIILNSFIFPALLSISMQKLLLTFINENAIRWILPVAFVLRVFIPTRNMGNILIGLAIALYVLVPFMYVFNFAMYESVLTDCIEFSEAVCDNAVDSHCDPAATTCSNPDSFWNVARLIPEAFFLPNLTIAIVITFLTSLNKALRVIG